MPSFLLRRQVLVNLPTDNLEPQVARSIDFMVDRVSRNDCCITVIAYSCLLDGVSVPFPISFTSYHQLSW